jgi:hypothetical protein
MLPLRERPEFKRRYSAVAGLFLLHVFAHDDVLEFFFESRRTRVRSANCERKIKYCAQPGMAERSQWGNVGALSYSRRDAYRGAGSAVLQYALMTLARRAETGWDCILNRATLPPRDGSAAIASAGRDDPMPRSPLG